MSIKLQINSLEALERLLGGDTEVELDLRTSIVQEFSKKHLKGITQVFLDKGVENHVKNILENEGYLAKGAGYGNSIVLGEKAKDLIRDRAEARIRELICTEVGKVIDGNKTLKAFEEALERSAQRIADNLTDTNINDRINKLVDAKLKEKLGLK